MKTWSHTLTIMRAQYGLRGDVADHGGMISLRSLFYIGISANS